nr:RecName: Full=Trypsin inhibitor B chain [Albizia julibrissin]
KDDHCKDLGSIDDDE